MGYLAAAYAVFWGVSFIFVYILIVRQRKIQKELEILEQLTREEAKTE